MKQKYICLNTKIAHVGPGKNSKEQLEKGEKKRKWISFFLKWLTYTQKLKENNISA